MSGNGKPRDSRQMVIEVMGYRQGYHELKSSNLLPVQLCAKDGERWYGGIESSTNSNY